MTPRNAVYWTATIITAFSFFSGGAANLYRTDESIEVVTSLGYPVYILTILGIWNILGAIAILAPQFPRLKEWAYAGIVFDLTGAVFSHVVVGDPVEKIILPVALLGTAAVSWALRPDGRVLSAVKGETAWDATPEFEPARN